MTSLNECAQISKYQRFAQCTRISLRGTAHLNQVLRIVSHPDRILERLGVAEQSATCIWLGHYLIAIHVPGPTDGESMQNGRHHGEQALLGDMNTWTDPASKTESKVSRIADVSSSGPCTRWKPVEVALGHELLRVRIHLGVV
jgi:hypothetical protein